MAMIECVECGNLISDKSEICVHCGCPTKESITKGDINIDYSILNKHLKDDRFVYAVKYVKDTTGFSLDEAKNFVKDYRNKHMPSVQTVKSNLPKCPTCGSTNLKKISGTSKATSVVLWGLFSQKVKKTYHCNNCQYEW